MIFHFNSKLIILLIIASILLILSTNSSAEPYLAYKNNLKCMACHVNPNGGGLRNDFGRIYGQQLLPSKAASYDTTTLAKLTQFLTLGANSRFNATFQQNENGDKSQGFALSSTQIYLNIALPKTGLSFYLDQQVAPGTAINREAFVMYKFASGNFIKAGKLFLPYGLRIEDDSAFIRQSTGMNFDNSDNGVEFALDYSNTTIDFFVANGTSQASNNDNKFLYGIRAEHLFSNFRVGTTAMLNDGDKQVQQYNIYGGAHFGDFTLLTEVDYLILSQANPFDQSDIKQLVGLAEVNYQWQRGINLKFTAEYFDSDLDVNENQQTRYSVVAEYTPFANIQLRLGYRQQDDIPQKPQQNNDLLFVQSHFYF
ncbi:MAG: hypothetical protein JKX78_10650 [Alteromonadaceae bacterium]|nr:hypothetical protein [Alteromonadaceae bacterium]